MYFGWYLGAVYMGSIVTRNSKPTRNGKYANNSKSNRNTNSSIMNGGLKRR